MLSKITNLKILSCEISQLGIFSFLRLIYGNFRSRFQHFVRNVRNIFSSSHLSLLCAIGLSFSPLFLRAEWSSSDRETLSNINSNTSLTDAHIVQTYEQLQHLQTWLFNYLGYSSYASSYSGNTLHKDLLLLSDKLNLIDTDLGFSSTETLKMQLDQIIAALETINTSIEESGSGSGSGSDSESINQDWLKEETFNAFSSKYEEFANRYYTAFGFNEEESLKDYLVNYFNTFNSYSVDYTTWISRQAPYEPFPGNQDVRWRDTVQSVTAQLAAYSPFEFLAKINDLHNRSLGNLIVNSFKKQAWNDWQAHTNLVSTIETIFSRSAFDQEKEGLSYDSERGLLTLTNTGGTGSADESYSVTPVSTNSVDTAVTAITSSVEKVPLVYDKETVLNRYLNEGILSAGQNYGTDETGSQSSIVWRTSWWTIDFGEISRKYRSAITVSDLSRWRGYTEILWQIVAVVCCILLVRKFGNM